LCRLSEGVSLKEPFNIDGVLIKIVREVFSETFEDLDLLASEPSSFTVVDP
jgi:hypothetical protein